MANHLTPEELSEHYRMDRKEIIRLCLEEHVPIYHGKIDRALFEVVRAEHDRSFAAAASG
jgi:hypothetical protein